MRNPPRLAEAARLREAARAESWYYSSRGHILRSSRIRWLDKPVYRPLWLDRWEGEGGRVLP